MTKKVKDIYFKDGMGLPIYVMQNGETKYPYQMGSSFVWASAKEFAELTKQINEIVPPIKKPWYKKLFSK